MNANKYHIKFVNLAHRKDRLESMTNQCALAGIPAQRFEAIDWRSREWGPRYQKMFRRTPGACGCHESQVSVMREALQAGKHAVVFEDDCVFCSDFQERLAYIEKWMDTHEWDVFWLGASFHVPAWWHRKGHRERELEDCHCSLNKDAMQTRDSRIIQTFGAFITFAYIVNKNSLDKVLTMLDEELHTSIGIDWLFIKLQPKLRCFSFVPGLTRQYTNQSDIGNGITNWDGFLKMNGTLENSAYVFQDRMDMFDPTTFDWQDATMRYD